MASPLLRPLDAGRVGAIFGGPQLSVFERPKTGKKFMDFLR
jgi:hypothetical protein